MTRLTDPLRRVVKSASHAADLRGRRLPELRLRSNTATTPSVYYLSPQATSASGGIRMIHHHVEALTTLGYQAAVLVTTRAGSTNWFQSSARIVGAQDVTLYNNDVLVVPEFYGPSLGQLPRDIRTVIFNQGAHYTFSHVPFETTARGAPYAQVDNLLAILTVSQDSANILRFAFPDVRVEIARVVVHASNFYPLVGARERQLAFVTHRREHERSQLLHMLRGHGDLINWQLVPIAGRTELETAAIMRASPIFLSFSERDGFGLPPAEAMASGCYVVGYSGMGGREFFDPSYCHPVDDGDIHAYAQAVSDACAAYDKAPQELKKAGLTASERVTSRYSASNLLQDLSEFYGSVL